jgi:hypothetical protein
MIDFDNDDDVEVQEESKLAKWKNPPKLDDLKTDLTTAQSDHDIHKVKVNVWLDNLNITGTAKIDNGKARSNIVPKLIRKQAEWRYAALTEPFLSTDDLFNTDPITFEDKKAAVQNGLVLNNQFNTKIDKIKFIDEYIRTAVDEGTVVVRTGWDYEEEIVEEEVQDFDYKPSQDPNYLQQLQTLAQGKQDDPINFKETVPQELQQALEMSMQSGIPIFPQNVGSHTESKVKVTKNCPTVEVCNYNDVIIDPSCRGNTDKAQFIIFRFETSKSELEKDGIYSNLDLIETDTTTNLSQDNYYREQYSFSFRDKPRQKVVAYEYWGYWDIDGSGVVKPIVVTWVGNQIIRQEANPFPDKKLPFVIVQYLPIRKAVYGEPDGELLEDNQKIIGAVTRGMIDIMGRSANAQQGISKDALDVVNKRKFEQGKDYEFNPGRHPSEAFYMAVYPEIPKSAQYMINMQNMEAESITGVKSFSQGIGGQSLGNVAIGVRGALDAASKRELGILRRLAQGIIQIGRKFISMNSEFLSEEEVIRITNEEFVTVRRDDLAGNIDISLTISTAEADEQKAQDLSFMLQTMGNTMPQDFSQIILIEIAKLRKMPDLAKKIEKYQPTPPPPDPLQEAQLQLLQSQIQEIQAKIAEYQAQTQLEYAKIATEQSKAKQLSSLADKTDLDFVNDESGVAHQRAMETAQAQAQGNIALEQIKHEQAVDKSLIDHNLNTDLENTKHQNNLQNIVLDHASSMDQIKAKPKLGVK